MNAAVLPRDHLMPPQRHGLGPGLVLAIAVHVGLVVALAFSVNWHASEPEGVQAELWASVPQVAAPRAAEPEPTPPPPTPKPVVRAEPPPPAPLPDAQIGIEKAKQEKLKAQQEKKEQEDKLRAAKLDAALKKKQDEARAAAQVEAQREANIKRILGQAGATSEGNGKDAQTAGPSASYAGLIKGAVKPNILLTDDVPGNPVAEVEVRTATDGSILGSKLVKSSGVKEWDDAVLRAIDRTGKLPRDVDGRVISPIVISFRPRDF